MTPALFRQFRKQYSSSSLTTELLLVQEGYYVVRATATLKSEPLATAMAADMHLEVAEDRAITRLLTFLGIQETLPADNLAMLPDLTSETVLTEAPGVIPELTPEVSTPVDLMAKPIPTHEPELDLTLVEPPEDDRPIAEIPDEGASLLKVSATHTPETSKNPAPATMPPSVLAANTLETLETSNNPVDLSDIIAQTDVEMSRLGWSNLQGREYLEKTYHKRSRQQLTDEELLEFLLYLESQPAPVS